MRIVATTFRTFFWFIFAIVLLVAGLLMTIYSPWLQDTLRQRLVDRLNEKPGIEVRLDSLRLRFPLKLDLSGVMLVQDGDTLIAASKAKADVALLPLFRGKVEVDALSLRKARYQMGNQDSLMIMVVKADTLDIAPAHITLSPLDITIDDGRMASALIDLTLKPDTAPQIKEKPDTVAPLTINVKRLAFADFTYHMNMLPTIDSLSTAISNATLMDAAIDLQAQTIKISQFTGSGLDAAYIACSPQQIAEMPTIPPTPDGGYVAPPWIVKIDSLQFEKSKGLYTTRGVTPLPGLDFAYIQADDMDIKVIDFYNCGPEISLPITLKATERCGVQLNATGTFAMDSTQMYFHHFNVDTPLGTSLYANGLMGVGDLTTDPNIPLQLQAHGKVDQADAKLMFPAFGPYLALLPPASPISLDADVLGTPADLNIYKADLSINQCLNLKAKGRIFDVFAAAGPQGSLKFSGNIINVTAIVNDLAKGTGLSVPPMTLDGFAELQGNNMRGNINATTLGGKLALNADFNKKSEVYSVDLTTDKFPVKSFMKDLGVGLATVDIKAKGNGFDFFNPKTNLDANAKISLLEYNGYTYRDIAASALLSDGNAKIKADIDNSDIDLSLNAEGNLVGNVYDWTASVNSEHIDLMALNFTPEKSDVSVDLSATASYEPNGKVIIADLRLHDLDFTNDFTTYTISNVDAKFHSCDSLTSFKLFNRDLTANIESPSSLDSILARTDKLMAVIDNQLANHIINADTIQKVMPQFNLSIMSGADNFVNDILMEHKMWLRRIDVLASNDTDISLNGRIIGFNTGSMKMDTIGAYIVQQEDKVKMIAKLENRPGTLDDFAHVRLDLLLNRNQLAIRGVQQNIKNETGFDIGAMATYGNDSTLTARVFPLNPIIGYKNWSVNFDNYLKYRFPNKELTANIKIKNDKSSLALYTVPHPADPLHADEGDTDVMLKIQDVQLADWIVINPFAPPISGLLSADMQVCWNGSDQINGNGQVSLTDFTYNKERVGTFASDIDVMTTTSGMIRAKADLMVDGVKTMTLAGNLNDSTAVTPFNLDFSVIKFPLAIANPFLPEGMAKLSGWLYGSMDVSGNSDQPILNGSIHFEDAVLKLMMTNTDYKFNSNEIPVINNLVSFKDFGLIAANENPLLVNGTVNIAEISNPKIDLGLKANNIMVVNSNKASKGAEIYGKGYLDIDASVKGDLSFMLVDANVDVLSGTNITYILTDASSDIMAPSQSDMVKFVNFTDSLAMAMSDSINESEMLLVLDASLTIQSGTTVTVDLNTSARDKVQLQPEGTLNYTMSPTSDGRLTGRLVVNNGFARYTIPVVGSEKEFTFVPGSYVAFNGDILNPVLNIHANDIVKANVTQEGQNSRLVNFDIGLAVTGTLNTMNVSFDLSTTDDLTVANELQSMSAEQRANQAMNMLLYNVYTGPGTKANANFNAANPLFSFLESQVNNWAANNIKGVDLTFGINQYDQTLNGNTSSTMNYSYQVSKTLFNDRFKIVIGGNYSTDADADENLSENLFNDISFEYYLNKQQTMLVKLFRHTGYESILEGEITQTGVGFVYKRRLNNLVQILPRFMRPKKYRKIIL